MPLSTKESEELQFGLYDIKNWILGRLGGSAG